MASSYTTEPPPTASILLHTTAGALTVSLFANQTPLTCRNFLQHCLDGTYDNNVFHRVAPGFVIQTGDPTGTGEGGENIYDVGDGEFEVYDEKWARVMGREKGEKIQFGDEIHSRLKFNRRGLIGMAKGEGSSGREGYGTQFFITLGDARAQLEGRCTMFGRVEGDGIYNVVKIAEGELVEGTERPVYPEKIQKVEILEMPKGEAWDSMRRRERTAKRVMKEPAKKEKPKKKKAGKALLSFGGEEGDSDVGVAVRPKKAKFNTALIDSSNFEDEEPKTNGTGSKKNKSPPPARRKEPSTVPQKRKASSPTLSKTPSPTHRRTPSFHDSTTQFPLRNEESPSNSPTPVQDAPPRRHSTSKSKSALESEIAALKESMRRPNTTSKSATSHKKSALESLIPATSTRGRKRPRPGDTLKDDTSALKMLNAFRARLESTKTQDSATPTINGPSKHEDKGKGKEKQSDPYARLNGSIHPSSVPIDAPAEDEESQLCDLHFIADCQSCSNWSNEHPEDPSKTTSANIEDDKDRDFLQHSLSFARDRLGKDLEWKKNMRNLKQEDMGELGVIDVKGKERELKEREGARKRERGR